MTRARNGKEIKRPMMLLFIPDIMVMFVRNFKQRDSR
jgi:hypothetical protein